MNKSVTTLRTPVKLLLKLYPEDYNTMFLFSDWLGLAPDLRYAHMTHVTLSVIGLLLYWPVAVFIGHAETQRGFDPPTEANKGDCAIVCILGLSLVVCETSAKSSWIKG